MSTNHGILGNLSLFPKRKVVFFRSITPVCQENIHSFWSPSNVLEKQTFATRVQPSLPLDLSCPRREQWYDRRYIAVCFVGRRL